MATPDHKLVADIRHVWPPFWPSILAGTLLWLLAGHRPGVYQSWTEPHLWDQLRTVGVKPRRIRLRDTGPRSWGIRWQDIAAAPVAPRPAHVNDQRFPRRHRPLATVLGGTARRLRRLAP